MKNYYLFYVGTTHNSDSLRPVVGKTYYRIGKDWTVNTNTAYTLINVLTYADHDSYVLKNEKNGKISNASKIAYDLTVSIAEIFETIHAGIDSNGNGIIDFDKLRKQLEAHGNNETRRALKLYDAAKTGSIAEAYKLIEYLLTTKYDGKMEGMTGISTAVNLNPHCACNRMKNGSICQDCYSAAMKRTNLSLKLAVATYVLCTYVFRPEQIPYLNCVQFRFESFADLLNETQARNYLTIAAKNPDVKKAIWTKRPAILYNAIMKYFDGRKPENFRVIVSSLYINHVDDVFNKFILANNMDMVDSIFTVYHARYAIENNIDITCIDNVCMQCKVCYVGGVKYVNEIVKNEQSLYFQLKAAM